MVDAREEFWRGFNLQGRDRDDYSLVSSFLEYLTRKVDAQVNRKVGANRSRVKSVNNRLRFFGRVVAARDKQEIAKLFKKFFRIRRRRNFHKRVREYNEDIQFLISWVISVTDQYGPPENPNRNPERNPETNPENNPGGLTQEDLNAAIRDLRDGLGNEIATAIADYNRANPAADNTEAIRDMNRRMQENITALNERLDNMDMSDPETARRVQELREQINTFNERMNRMQELLENRGNGEGPGTDTGEETREAENTALRQLLEQLAAQAQNRDDNFIEHMATLQQQYLEQMERIQANTGNMPEGMQNVLQRLTDLIEVLVQDRNSGNDRPEEPPQEDPAILKMINDRLANLEGAMNERNTELSNDIKSLMEKYEELNGLPAAVKAEVVGDVTTLLDGLREELSKSVKSEDLKKTQDHLKRSFAQRIGRLKTKIEKLLENQKGSDANLSQTQEKLRELSEKIDAFAKDLEKANKHNEDSNIKSLIAMLREEIRFLTQLIFAKDKKNEVLVEMVKALPPIPERLSPEQKSVLEEIKNNLSEIVKLMYNMNKGKAHAAKKGSKEYIDYIVDKKGMTKAVQEKIHVVDKELEEVRKKFLTVEKTLLVPALMAGKNNSDLKGQFLQYKESYKGLKHQFPGGINRWRINRKVNYETPLTFYVNLHTFIKLNHKLIKAYDNSKLNVSDIDFTVEAYIKYYRALKRISEEKGIDNKLRELRQIEGMKRGYLYKDVMDEFFKHMEKIIDSIEGGES